MRNVARALCLLILATATAPPVLGRSTPDQAREGYKSGSRQHNRVVQRWKNKLDTIDLLIKAGRGRKALKEADALTEEMLDRMISGDDVGHFLGIVYTLRALAAVQTGDRDQGLWHWHVGVQMFPALKSFDLTSYGEEGQFLLDHPLKAVKAQYAFPAPKITPPKKISAPQPKYPEAKRLTRKSLLLIVRTIIDKNGRLKAPRILRSAGELTMACAALEAFRKWRFEPARLDGEPVEVWYNVTVNFKLR